MVCCFLWLLVAILGGQWSITESISYAGCNEADLIHQDETLNTTSCADKGVVNSSSISGGVVCYNGAIAGSRADYICNSGFVLVGNKATRVCQSDGNWNGSIPWCSPDKPGMYVCAPLSSAQRYIYMLIGSNLECIE